MKKLLLIVVVQMSAACAHLAPQMPPAPREEKLPGGGAPAGATVLDWYVRTAEAQPVDPIYNPRFRSVRVTNYLAVGAVTPSGVPSGTGTAFLASRLTTNGALWLGVASPNVSNYALSSSSAGDTEINASAGQPISFAINNSVVATLTAATLAYSGHVDITGVNAGNYGLGFATGTNGICFNGTGAAGCTLGMQWNSATGAISLIETSGYFGHSTAVGTPASGTGITATYSGALRQWAHKVVVTKTAMAAAGTTDVTIHLTPVNTVVRRVLAEVTEVFDDGAGPLTAVAVTCGKTAGGNEYLLTHSELAATGAFGDVVAEMGAGVVSATLADMGTVATGVPGAITVQCRFTCTGANCSVATTGSTTFIVEGVTY